MPHSPLDIDCIAKEIQNYKFAITGTQRHYEGFPPPPLFIVPSGLYYCHVPSVMPAVKGEKKHKI